MLKWMTNNPLLSLGIVIGIAWILSAWVFGLSLIGMKKLDQNLSVTGSAQQPITANLATWQCRFSRQANNIPNAYTALKSDLLHVQQYLKSQGLTEANWEVRPVETVTLYTQTSNGSTTNEIEGYRLTQTLSIEHPDVKLVTRIAQEAGSLMVQGIGLDTQSPQYFYTKLDDLKVEMLGKAMKNALARAEQMANSTGSHIGSIRSAQMGVFQITPKNSTDVADSGINDTSTIDKTVTAVVNASFSIN